MEFDPIKNVWLGNEKDLAVFRPTPAYLIQPKTTNLSKNQKVGEMEFDAVEKVWRGNEKDLKRFSNAPSFLPASSYNQTELHEQNGMVFDPEEMKWKGNDGSLDIFSDIEKSEDERGFIVGKEFNLSPDLINSFKKCEEEHNSSLQGWCSYKEIDPKKHLNAIRSMSIIRIINQAKSYSQNNLSSISPASPNASTNRIALNKSSTRSEKDFEDFEENKSTPTSPVTRLGTSGPSNGGAIEKNVTPSPLKKSVSASTSLNNQLEKFSEENEDWEELEIDKINLNSSNVLPSSEPFEDSSNKLLLSSDEEDFERNDEWDGLQVDSSSVFLRKPLSITHPLSSIPKTMLTTRPSIIDDSNPEESEDWGIPDQASVINLTPEKREVVEETWSDVEFPSNQPITFRPFNHSISREPVTEDLSDLVLPQDGGLVLTTRNRAKSFDDEEDPNEEEWNDIDIPDNFSGRVKKN